VALQAAAGEDREDGPIGGAEEDEQVAGGAGAAGGQGRQIAFADHKQDTQGSQENAAHLEQAELFAQQQPAEQGHENGRGGDNPGRGGGLGGDQAGGLKPLVEGDAQKTEQGEIGQLRAGRESQLAAGGNRGPQDGDAHQKAQPDDRERSSVLQGDLGGDERSTPHRDGKSGLHIEQEFRRHWGILYPGRGLGCWRSVYEKAVSNLWGAVRRSRTAPHRPTHFECSLAVLLDPEK
jgi:hypothetical protein